VHKTEKVAHPGAAVDESISGLHHEVFGEVAFARPVVVAAVESSDVIGKVEGAHGPSQVCNHSCMRQSWFCSVRRWLETARANLDLFLVVPRCLIFLSLRKRHFVLPLLFKARHWCARQSPAGAAARIEFCAGVDVAAPVGFQNTPPLHPQFLGDGHALCVAVA
jgi:hypothetical protein